MLKVVGSSRRSAAARPPGAGRAAPLPAGPMPPWAQVEALEARTLLSVAGYPDLAVENLVVPAGAAAGDTITVQYDLVNHGDQPFAGGQVDYLYLSAQAKPSLSAAPIAQPAHAAEIPAGGTLHISQDITVPLSTGGKQYVAVLTNPYEKVPEGKQVSNDRAYAAITVAAAPPADLCPVYVSVGFLGAGETVHVTGAIENKGANTATAGWSDAVYLSSDASLDSKDVLLGTFTPGSDLPAGQRYVLDLTATVPPQAVGDSYIIVKTDYNRLTNEPASKMANNTLATAAKVYGAFLTGAYDGMFLARSAPVKLAVKSCTYTDAPGTTLSLDLGSFTALPIMPDSAGSDLSLLCDQRLPTGLKTQTVSVNPAGAALGQYQLTVTVSYGDQVLSQQSFEVTVVDDVLRQNDKVGDALGGSDYEIYNMEIGRAGDSLLFRVGTNYDGTDGDFRIGVGKAPSQSVFGLALGSRTSGSGQSVTAGDLYTGATFAIGQAGARYPALIDSFAQEIAGESFASVSDHQGYNSWRYDILGGVPLGALGVQAATLVDVSWTMSCGNDYQDLAYKNTQPLAAWIAQNVHDPDVNAALTGAMAGDYQLSRTDMIDVLNSVLGDDGLVDKTELADLKTIVKNAPLLGAADSVRVLAGRVVNGDHANRHYQGQHLGNLYAGSDSTQMDELVQKWFYGADHPLAEDYSYTQISGSLFQSGVSYEDVRQGTLGDCYFLTALAAIAQNSPDLITNMFTDNGDGTYTVGFHTAKGMEYVTVDSYLPTDSGYLTYAGYASYYSDTSNELWVPLAEKAYAQLADSGRTGQGTNTDNSYADIASGMVASAVHDLTARKTADFPLYLGFGVSTYSLIEAAYYDYQWLWVSTNPKVSDQGLNLGLVEDHTYAVVGYDPGAGTFTLYNPWGIDNGEAPGLVTLTWAQMEEDCSSWGTTL